MEEKSTQQNGQNGQGQKPTLQWSQPNTNQNQQNTNQKQLTAGTSSGSGLRMVSISIGIFVVCILAVWGMVVLRHRSAEVVSITGTSSDEMMNTKDQDAVANTDAQSAPSASAETAVVQPNSPVAPAAASGALTVTVPSPQAAGMSVAVSGVAVSVPTWVVVYQDNGGKPGSALGAGLFLPNGDNAASVPLLRATEAGKSYLVGELIDSGDKVFSLHGDAQIKDEQGNPLFVTFQAN